MLLALLLLSQGPSNETIAKIDALAKARDVNQLSVFLAPFKGRNPLNPIRSGGAYGTGRFGWRAVYLRMLTDSFIVFTTPLTSEDVGELLFKFNSKGQLEYVPEDYTNGQRIGSHDLEVRFDLAGKKAIIKDTIDLQIVGDRNMVPILRIGPNYKVQKITNSQGTEIAFLQAGGIVALPSQSATQKLTLQYTGVVDKPEYAGSISENEVMLTNDYWYPMIARQPAPYRLKVTVPKGWTPVGQGELVQKQETAAGTVATYEMKLPITYWSFSAAPYRTAEAKTNGRSYRMWSSTLTKQQMDLQNEIFPAILDFYERLAKYPFSSWGAVVSPAYGGGALEAYSFATYGDGLPGEDAHEPAHTWFGGMINNTYLKSMWNESFASFCEGFYARNVPIGNVEERRLAFIETPSTPAQYLSAPLSEASPFIGPSAVSIGYGKGGYVLQMLEQEIGTERMIKSMQGWLAAQPKTRGGEWSDFEAAVDRVPGNDTHWFFEQWVNRPGWVDFTVEDLKWTNQRLVGQIAFKGDPYIINSEVLIRDGSGKDSFVTAKLSANTRDKRQQFVIPCQIKPKLVSFDPWRRILRPIQSNEAPTELQNVLPSLQRYTDPRHTEYLRGIGGAGSSDFTGTAGRFIVGHPDTVPQMKALCEKAGFKVSGNKLTYKGTEIDLTKGAALAVVELGEGKMCAIGLGQTRLRPRFGRAKTVLVDDLGRFLRGETEPKTAGFLTFTSF